MTTVIGVLAGMLIGGFSCFLWGWNEGWDSAMKLIIKCCEGCDDNMILITIKALAKEMKEHEHD